MNFYEATLRKVFDNVEGIENTKYIGRNCLAELGGGKVMKASFVQTAMTGGKKDSLGISIISKNDGEIDGSVVRFADIWPQRYNISGSKEGPLIWTYNGKDEWLTPEPSGDDYMKLSKIVSDYVSFYSELDMEQNEGMSGMGM